MISVFVHSVRDLSQMASRKSRILKENWVLPQEISMVFKSSGVSCPTVVTSDVIDLI